jgi:hypothetical protein
LTDVGVGCGALPRTLGEADGEELEAPIDALGVPVADEFALAEGEALADWLVLAEGEAVADDGAGLVDENAELPAVADGVLADRLAGAGDAAAGAGDASVVVITSAPLAHTQQMHRAFP